VTERKRAAQAVEASRLQLRRLAARIEAVREEERTRLSREVHDVLGQALTGLNMDISIIEKELSPGHDSIEDRLEEMKEALQEMVQVVRRIAHDLRPGILDDLGLIAALEWETEKFATRTQLDCSFDESVDHIVLDRERATSIFRVFQEILTNIVRHAEATRVSVSVSIDEGNLVLQVADDGRGIEEEDLNNSTSLGLLGMRERLYPWKGRVMFKGRPEQGTTVTVTVPLPQHLAA
jgi:signal transduction histidine kinase